MPTDYDEELSYDADHEDDSQYCVHGTWIGSWWGPDYLCIWCEEGISLEDFKRAQHRDWMRRQHHANLYNFLAHWFSALPPSAQGDDPTNRATWAIAMSLVRSHNWRR